jgi:serine/threonine protein kinase
MLQRGQILLGKYRVVRLLGQGGMGAVYLAEHTRLPGQLLAIKENIPELSTDPATQAQLRRQFYTEARTLAGLDHPNLPKVSDFFIEGGVEYLVMDYIEGDALDQVLAKHLQQTGRPLPEAQVLAWADQILAVLSYLHSRQPSPVIHRDVKPANIILAPNGRVHLVDFGLVKLLSGAGQSTAAAMRGMGTPEYTALEQYGFGVGRTDARTDLYALAATLYHLLTGQAPLEVPQRVLQPKGLAAPKQLNPSLSTNTASAIIKALEIQPDQRYQSADEMRMALARAPAAYRQQSVTVRRQPERFVWLLFGSAILLATLALAVMLSAAANRRAPSPASVGAVIWAATAAATTEHTTAATAEHTTAATAEHTTTAITEHTTTAITEHTATATAVAVLRANTGAVATATRIPRLTPTSTLQPTFPPPTNTPTDAPRPTLTPSPRPTSASSAPAATVTPLAVAQTAQPMDSWVMVADSVADFPGPLENRKWWYLWSSGRNNFEWQEMGFDGGCYRSPNDWGLQICRELVTSGARGDVALQYKVQQGGTYRIDWQADPGVLFYRHLRYVSSERRGSQVFEGLIDWEMFFFVVRNSGVTNLAVQVYRLQP